MNSLPSIATVIDGGPVASTFGVEPRRCVAIDDSPHRIAGAVPAGMTAIGSISASVAQS